MNTSTLIFKSKSAPRVSIFGLLLLMLSFFTVSKVNAQNISELNQFLESQEAADLGIDRDYLYGNKPTAYVSSSRANIPNGNSPIKVDVSQNSFERIARLGSELETVEILRVKLVSENEKSGSIPSSVLDYMPSLKVILIVSEVPISSSDVVSMVSQIQNPAIKILYIYSQPS